MAKKAKLSVWCAAATFSILSVSHINGQTNRPVPLHDSSARMMRSGTLAEWRMTNGDAAQSRYIAGEIKPPFRVQWKRRFPLGAGTDVIFGQMVAAGNTLYLIDASHVVAVEADTGRIRWDQVSPNTRSMGASYYSLPHFVAMSDGVIVPSDGPALVKRSAKDGSIIWKQNIGVSLGCVLLQSGHLFATDFDFEAKSFPLFELDATTGDVLTQRTITADSLPDTYKPIYARWFGQMPDSHAWLFVGGGHALTTLESVSGQIHGLCYNGGVTAALPGHLFVCQGDWLWAMRPNTDLFWHSYLWATPALMPMPTIITTPSAILMDDLQYTMAFDPKTGRKLWSRRGGDKVEGAHAPVAVGGSLYMLSSRKTRRGSTRIVHALSALNIRNGKPRWSVPLTRSPQWLYVHKGAIYVHSVISSPKRPTQLEVLKLVPGRRAR